MAFSVFELIGTVHERTVTAADQSMEQIGNRLHGYDIVA